MKKLILLVLSLLPLTMHSQSNKGVRAGAGTRVPIEVTFLGFGIPQTEDLELVPQLTHKVSKNESSNQKELEILKAELKKQKDEYVKEHEGELEEETPMNKKTRTNDPSLIIGYNALGNQGTPSDNTMAINTLDQIICSVNSSLRIYNANTGAGLAATVSLSNFFSSPQNGSLLTNNLCDPKVMFDPQAKRFIVFAQTCDGGSSTSQILVAFAKAEDPTQGWYFYTFTGNPSSSIGQSAWFDYPKVGVSNSDFFATGNLFDNNYDYVQSVIYQINKTKCYAGNTLGNGDALLWYNIDYSPFTMVPMTNGQLGGYGNNMYLASTGGGAFGATINMYEIDNSTVNNPNISASLVSTDTASAPGNGDQSGSAVDLETGDSRGMDGFYLNGTVHYVFHCNVGGGYSGINYSRLTKSGATWTLKKRIIKMSGKDLAYPAIASMGWSSADQSAIIGFNYASSSEFPGMKAVYVDHDFTPSTPIEIKTGTGYASVLPDNGVTRWGDYSGMSRVHNATKPTAWHFGMFGNTSHTWTNHFAKISTNGWPLGTEVEAEKNTNTARVYPNPIVEDIYHTMLNLDEAGTVVIDLLDLKGQLVRKVYTGYASKGENMFSFNRGALATGTYVLSIKMNSKLIKNEKISVIHP
jgi:hypothetical protein